MLIHGDMREQLPLLDENSFDAVVSDPPYDLTSGKKGGSGQASLNLNSPAGRARIGTGGFMGAKWDSTGIAFDADTWRAVLRVAKPGAYLLAFGGTRTHHRMMTAIEDAGWELRDCLMWIYASGFPKSALVSLKPAYEPIVLARKPLNGTIKGNIMRYGTGALNIEAARVPVENRGRGRWPANVLHDGSVEVTAAFPYAAGQLTDRTSVGRKTRNTFGAFTKNPPCAARNDPGNAARFFYCARAAPSDRGKGNTHPTVKPTELMRYLVRLITPEAGIVLDPFAGSGSTGKAAQLEGRHFVGVEQQAEFVEMAERRIAGVR